MKKALFCALCAFFVLPLSAQKQNATYLAYIDQWKSTAIQQQADYGIPATITMAQALLESAAGQSELAVNANNHFGIKCTSDWFGGVYYHDDETEGECFRQYYDAAESFKDHSLFLQRSRYASCFEIAIEDYEGWANRLRQCGYATDKLYAQKLIKIIEDYKLDSLFANMPVGDIQSDKTPNPLLRDTTAVRPKAEQKKEKVIAGSEKKAAVVYRSEPIAVITHDPEPEYQEPLTAREEKQLFMLNHPKKKCNGVTYVMAREDDTYANVAFRLNLRERDLREYNDALGRDLKKGERIFLSRKKTAAPKEKALMWVHPGESLWDNCQREGGQMKAVQKLNGFEPSLQVFRTRQQIYLAKVKEK